MSSNRIILKTCGSTSLLFSVQPLMALVKKYFPNAQMQVGSTSKGCMASFKYHSVSMCTVLAVNSMSTLFHVVTAVEKQWVRCRASCDSEAGVLVHLTSL